MSFRSRRLLLILAALMGIVLAVAVTWATSQIVSQRIGLSSEPVTAGLRLAPAHGRTPKAPVRSTSTPARSSPTTQATTPSAPAPATTTARQAPEPAPVPGAGERHEGGDHAAGGDD